MHVRELTVIIAAVACGNSWAETTQPRASVVDRTQLTPVEIQPRQGGIAAVTLLAGDDSVALVEIVLPKDVRLDLTATDRHELWFITTGFAYATGYYDRFRQTVSPDWKELDTGGLMDIPAGSFRRLDAGVDGLSALIVYVPGNIDGALAQKLLPGTVVNEPGAKETKSRVRYTKKLQRHKAKDVQLSVIELAAKRKLPAARGTELVYVVRGAGTAHIDGQNIALAVGSVVHVPKGSKRTITTDKAMRVLQIFVTN